MKPKLGYVVKRYPRFSETFVVNEVLAHERAGVELVIFALRAPEDTHFQDGISRVRAPVVYLPDRVQKASEFWALLREGARCCPDTWPRLSLAHTEDAREVLHAVSLANACRQHGISHLHAHFATSATTAARLAAKFTDIPYTFTAHAKDIFHESIDAQDLYAKVTDASAVVTVSDFNRAYLRRRFGAVSARIKRIYNGMDLSRLAYRDAQYREPVIVGVGRLVEKKGFIYLVRACRRLRDAGVQFKCEIIGSGPEARGLQNEIRALGLELYVKLLGPRPQRELVKMVARASALALPCVVGTDGNRDGLPTVLLEAMALGTPCVSTDVTGVPEVIKDGDTGLLVPQHDAVQLGQALARLLHDSGTRVALARAARRLVEQHFDVDRNACELRKLFVGLTAPPSRALEMSA